MDPEILRVSNVSLASGSSLSLPFLSLVALGMDMAPPCLP